MRPCLAAAWIESQAAVTNESVMLISDCLHAAG